MKEYEQKICNIIENLKVEMRYQCDKLNEQAYKQGYKQGYADGYEIGKQDGYKDGQESLVNAYAIGKGEATLEDVKKAEYIRGLNDAWEVAGKLHKISVADLSELFDMKSPYFDFSAQEVLDKIKAYEDKQKDDDWRDIPSEEMTLEQARRAVKELRAEVLKELRGAE